jgi:hypothetical protein
MAGSFHKTIDILIPEGHQTSVALQERNNGASICRGAGRMKRERYLSPPHRRAPGLPAIGEVRQGEWALVRCARRFVSSSGKWQDFRLIGEKQQYSARRRGLKAASAGCRTFRRKQMQRFGPSGVVGRTGSRGHNPRVPPRAGLRAQLGPATAVSSQVGGVFGCGQVIVCGDRTSLHSGVGYLAPQYRWSPGL